MYPAWPRLASYIPLKVTVRKHCLLFTSHSRTDSSWEPERRALPSVDTDKHVTWFLGKEDGGWALHLVWDCADRAWLK